MAHAFKIMDNTNTITTYTDYDSIPLTTLKHVISFLPDIGTEVGSNEILLESDNFFVKVGVGILAPGHVMIIPKEHISCYAELSNQLGKEFISIKYKKIR